MTPSFPRMPRRTLLASIIAVPALAVAACSSDDSGSSDASASDSSSAGGIETKFGTITPPENPTNVVALGWGDAETALALGVQPVGASDWLAFGGEGVGPWAEGLYDKAPTIIETQEPDFEAIAALKPDLILDVKSSGDQDRYDKLSSIATTVGVPEGGDSYLTSRDQQVTMIAAALGKADEGKKLLEDTETKFKDAAEANPAFAGKSISVAAYTSEGWGAYIEKSERVAFMEDLGFTQNPAVEKLTPNGFTADISPEELDTLEADVLVVFPIYVPAADVTGQAAFTNLQVVKDKHAIVFGDDEDDIANAYSLNSVLSIPYAIEKVVPKLQDVTA